MSVRIGTHATTSISPARETYIAVVTVIAIGAHLILRYSTHLPPSIYLGPLFLALIVGGIPVPFEPEQETLAARVRLGLAGGNLYRAFRCNGHVPRGIVVYRRPCLKQARVSDSYLRSGGFQFPSPTPKHLRLWFPALALGPPQFRAPISSFSLAA
jgi:hypothetical protein